MKERKEKISKTKNKGFTLIEMLVVVLIIGILAAIALPQYQMAVGKAKFSTLKNITKSLQEASQRYYLIHKEYPKTMAGIDIDLSIKNERTTSSILEITTIDNINCNVWFNHSNTGGYIACYRKIFGKNTHYYVRRETGIPLYCLVSESPSPTHPASRLCAKETNRPITSSCTTICEYNY